MKLLARFASLLVVLTLTIGLAGCGPDNSTSAPENPEPAPGDAPSSDEPPPAVID